MKPSTVIVGAVVAANTAALVVITNSNHELQQTNREIVSSITALNIEVKQLQEAVLYKTHQTVGLSETEQECLARNVFYEAGVENYAGKIAVAQVTVNRLKERRWGSDVCKVVYAPSQFSWTKDKKKRWAKPKGKLWDASQHAVRDFLKGVRVKNLERSHFYHTNYIKQPNWAKAKKQVHTIGQHIFYTDT